MKTERYHSQNGRWGIDVVFPVEITSLAAPIQGSVKALGTLAGVETFQVVPDEAAPTWIIVEAGDLAPIEGCALVASRDLQGGNSVTLLVLGPEAIVRWTGYKGRSSSIRYYANGKKKDIQPSVLLALGLIKPEKAPEEVAAPPPVSTTFAEAMARAMAKEV